MSEGTYKWRPGYVPPKNVDVEALGKAIQKMRRPDDMMEAAKEPGHCLHEYLYSQGDQHWAYKARRDATRHVMGGVIMDLTIKGGATIVSRVVEYLPPKGKDEGDYFLIDDIRHDRKLLVRYLDVCAKAFQNAMNKLDVAREIAANGDDDETE